MGGGFIGSVKGVRTAKGVTDRLTANPSADSVTSSGERTRSLQLEVGSEKASASRLATISTRTFAGGAETVRMPGGSSLSYEHDGPPTTFSFELSSMQRGATAAHFRSGPMTIGRGDRVVATPGDRRRLGSVRVSVRRADGSRTSRTVRNRATSPVRIAISGLRVRKPSGRNTATVTTRLRRAGADSVLGVTLRLTRDGRTVARRGFAVRNPRDASRTFSFKLPRSARGGFRLVAHMTVAATGARPDTKRAARAAAGRIR